MINLTKSLLADGDGTHVTIRLKNSMLADAENVITIQLELIQIGIRLDYNG